jgi:hypothetical protein
MPTVTYDGRSFMLDGRRIWLVSGSIHYARVPREHWEERIHAAKLAGLNCIESPVFWNRHEPRAGTFDFAGDNDIRHFVTLIGQAGMYCILRPGPFVGADWDFGGLPPWLKAVKNVKFRAANGPFLEACSRYLTAVADKVRDLQVTAPGKGGPILLVQNEAGWTCGDDKEGQNYLGELNRYLREAGLNVPFVNSNNLWQGVEGEIDAWVGTGDMLGTIRQLGAVRPDQPRMVIEYRPTGPCVWGEEGSGTIDPGVLQSRLAQILAAGGQFNLYPFHGGTNFGFWGGRLPETPGYLTATYDCGAPISETGIPGPTYNAVRRICTFASRFGRVFANLDPSYRPVSILPSAAPAEKPEKPEKGKKETRPVAGATLVHASGPQGGVVFIFAAPGGKGGSLSLLLPDGTSLPVEIGDQAVTWCLFDTFLGGRARLDYSSFSAFAIVGKVLVLFGPAGAEGIVSINGSPMDAVIPKGKSPAIVQHEGITVVLCTAEQVDSTYITEDAVYLGVAGLTREGQPIAIGAAKQVQRLDSEGASKNIPAAHPPTPKKADKVPLSDWAMAGTNEYMDGTSPRYATIDGPAELASLGSAFGYGWYRLRIKSNITGRAHLAFPAAGDRLLVRLDGEPVGIVGHGPGAAGILNLNVKKGNHTLVALAENMGRLCGGVHVGESKGLYGDVWSVEAIKVPKPALKTAEPMDVLSFRTPIWEVQPGDLTLPDRLTWTLAHRRKTPVLMIIPPFHGRGLLVLNGAAIAFLDSSAEERIVIPAEQLKTGNNTVQVALLAAHGAGPEDAFKQLTDNVEFYDAEEPISGKAEWAFAKWEPPRATAFQKGKTVERPGPTWWRAHFTPPSEHGLLFDATGLTKGQIYINGRHVSRYFVAMADGKPVPPQTQYYIPGPWLKPGQDNELLIFDENGGNPSKTRLASAP